MREIRRLTEEDFIQSLELSQYAFQYVVPKEDYPKRKETFITHEVWGEFEDGKLSSKAHIIPLQIFLGEKLVSMGGLAGVATWPEYRRNGSVTRLMIQSLQSMKEKGQTLSMLHPFDFHFYRRFGWEYCFTQKKITVDKKDLHFMQEAPGRVRRLVQGEELPIVNDLYEKYAKNYNGMLQRTTSWWEKNVSSPGYQFVLYTDHQGEPAGYLLYKNADQLLDVQEFVYVNEEARRGLWNFICQHDSMVNQVKLILTEDDSLPFLLKNPKVKIELEPYFMARIVDVKGFLEQYEFEKVVEGLVLHIQDDQAKWNQISIKIENGEISVASKDDRGLALNIQALTAVLLGAQKADFLFRTGDIKGTPEQVAILSKLIPNRGTSLIDFF
ncbi:GNAT family N-acetyltransferase [Bacillus pinisoli]|uniref:GNAT family N-acetyltransferase n=1 Tax=Bacillus pinisoli TaxID=2901866 RepID=UPI001FF4F3A3|nr:GNAT family N-acetyltransferase [Bacillus pinisoli]